MKKKVLLTLAGIGAVVASAAMFAAFEAHVINVTAKIENALYVPVDDINFGQVFPQEEKDFAFTMSLSESFIEASETIGEQWAASVVSYEQGDKKDGTDVLAERSDPTNMLGEAQNDDTINYFSLGFGGNVVLYFNNYIVNKPGNDVEIFVTETSYGSPSCASYPEKVTVEASQDGSTWTPLGTAGCLDSSFDLGGLSWAKYLRLTDVSSASSFNNEADGYDIDGVKATSVNRLGTVDYMIRQKPKCYNATTGEYGLVTEDDAGTFVCVDEGYEKLPVLCPYLSKHSLDEGENDGDIAAFHGDMDWTMEDTLATEVYGHMSSAGDTSDVWNIDFKAPCFEGECAQDWADFVAAANADADPLAYDLDSELKGQELGCDLWIEVMGIDEEDSVAGAE